MEHINENIKVLIVSESLIIRLGIISLLRKSGIEASVKDVSSLESFKNGIASEPDYIIFDAIFHKKYAFLIEIPDNKKQPGILIIGDTETSTSSNAHVINHHLSEEEYSTQLLEFFRQTDPQKEKSEELNILSERELDVLREVALGFANKEIAGRLFISINTVITHRKNITEKLGIKTIAGLTVYALMNDLISAKDVHG